MKSLINLSLLLALGNGVVAAPTAAPTEVDDLTTSLIPLGDFLSDDVSDLANQPYIPLGTRAPTEVDDVAANLIPVGEFSSHDLSDLANQPYVPLGEREASRMAEIKARAAKAFGKEVDMDQPIGLDSYKRSASASAAGMPAGHPMTRELLQLLERSDIQTEASKVKRGTFNAAAQKIDISGDHAFIAPDFANGAKRGPCPGMNTLANHGFVDRSGIASLTETIVAANNVFGMGVDISTFLATYSTVFGGSLVSVNPSYSIGDYSDKVENALDNVGGLLGKPMGLDNVHNTFEVDGSSTRGDLYTDGNSWDLNMTLFMDLYNLQIDAEVPNYDVDVIIQNSLASFNRSIENNPYFYYGPFSGLILRSGAAIFGTRLFGNASEQYPDGSLDKETLKSFYGVTGPEDNMTYARGHERIPENWYRRAGDYGIPSLGIDIVNLGIHDPRILGVGGNVNGVNTYAGINPADIVGGALTDTELLEGNNLICFAFQTLKLGSPAALSSIYATIDGPLEALLDIFGPLLSPLGCPTFDTLSYGGTDLFSYMNSTYPGAAKSGGGL